jgi:hypothetical protein
MKHGICTIGAVEINTQTGDIYQCVAPNTWKAIEAAEISSSRPYPSPDVHLSLGVCGSAIILVLILGLIIGHWLAQPK